MQLLGSRRMTLSRRMIPASIAVLATLTSSLAIAGCAAPQPPAALSIDGYAIGPARSVSGDEFHRLEVTARDVVRTTWPGKPMTSIQLASAGTLADGSIQAGTEGPFTFLVVIAVNGAGRHAFVLECNDATFPAPNSCAAIRNGPS